MGLFQRPASIAAAALLVLLLGAPAAPAAAQGLVLPKVSLEAVEAKSPQEVATALEIVAILTVLSLAPAILLMLTSFTRVIIVLSLLRHAIGVQQLPPNQVIVGLSLFLTVFIMAPVGEEIHRSAWEPYMAKRISQPEALSRALQPLREFMLRQTRQSDLALMVGLARAPAPGSPSDLPTHVLIPAFALSEIRTAFQIGFVLFVPFLVIDLVVASVLMSLGMMMLPPVMISLPFKLLLFVLADGWHLVVSGLVAGFR
ncbi:MAG: flagellar biosynthetic protein FliP [Candidatus Rokubacteria bacterium GWC2_70_24]|nr:MAG: flagellar biosynthetic protein FliP [Candidatus Rokubacteria bacterium GWC2_70_24]